MAYKLFASPQVDIDIDKAYEYYSKVSPKTIKKFDSILNELYTALETNPFYQIRYKNVRALPFKKLPYIIFFTVDQENKRVDILSVFQTKQNTKKYPLNKTKKAT